MSCRFLKALTRDALHLLGRTGSPQSTLWSSLQCLQNRPCSCWITSIGSARAFHFAALFPHQLFLPLSSYWQNCCSENANLLMSFASYNYGLVLPSSHYPKMMYSFFCGDQNPRQKKNSAQVLFRFQRCQLMVMGPVTLGPCGCSASQWGHRAEETFSSPAGRKQRQGVGLET